MVHTCPRCELRFLTEAELTEHLDVDHHLAPESFERFHYKPLPQRPVSRRFVVIANETLTDDSVLERIVDMTRDGHVHLVVPATPAEADGDAHDDKGLALATYRMRRAIDSMHASGIEAEGEVGHLDPVRAAADALAREHADEIIIATLPQGASKWLHVNVPAALEHRFGLPVTVLTTV